MRAASFGIDTILLRPELTAKALLLSTAQPRVAVSLKQKNRPPGGAAFVDKAGKARYDVVSFN